MKNRQRQIHRILDANFNRLREALRVVEEYYRFIIEDENICVKLKAMRHSLTDMEDTVGRESLLDGRDTETDCFASTARPEEMGRADAKSVLNANFKRAQEACRVIEEYSKISAMTESVSKQAKETRFALYAMQKASVLGIDIKNQECAHS
jgi:thiamine-phosphate pyrophosphorylase